MRTLRDVLPLVDAHMLAVIGLALLATFLCRETGLIVELPPDLVGIAVIFPIVFSIASAYTRREDALKSFALLKANAVALYYAHRDWPTGPRGLHDQGAVLIHDLLVRIAAYFRVHGQDDGPTLRDVYRAFDALSLSNEDLRDAGVSPTEVSRISQYLRDLIADFETMRNFAHYRTPVTLRAFSRLFLTAFPILLTPYFAFVGDPEQPWLGYVLAVLYSIVLVGLDNVQEHLENPYDGVGLDDLRLDIADEYLSMVRKEPAHPVAR